MIRLSAKRVMAPALRREGAMQRFALYLIVVSQLALPACTRDTTYHGEAAPGGLFGAFAQSFNLGEKAFAIVKSRLAASPVRPAEKVAALDARRADFVNAVNAILTADSIQQLGPTIKAFFGLVDDGTLPAMSLNVAEICDALANEPGQKTLRALVTLGSTRTILHTDDLLDYVARSANYPEIEQVFTAVAEIIRENDGVDDQGRPNGEPRLVEDVQALASRLLRDAAAPPPTRTPGLLDGLPAELLVDAPPRSSGAAALGAPSWIVRVDRHGNPAVERDPAAGGLYAPFRDQDGDGAADVDADRRPVDAGGRAIEVPAFGPPGTPGRDGDGRALAPSGALLYVYADSKRTLLSHFLQLGGEALRRGLHEQGFDVGEVALGPRVPNDNGTPGDASDDYLGFDPDAGLADLAFGGLELAKYEGAPKLLRAVADLGRRDPALAERLLVTVGKIIEKVRPIALAPSTTPPQQSRALTDGLVLLGDRVFDARQPPSVARVLLDVVHGIGRSARELPHELSLMARYRRLALDSTGRPLPAPQSLIVDLTRPPTRAGSPQGENRSCLHQLLDLLSEADDCKTFIWFGRPLAETIIELMAGRSAGTATSLIAFLRSSVIRTAVRIVCPAIDDDLDSLDALAASGALDGFLPIAKAFVDKGETRLLIDLLKRIAADYDGAIRPTEDHVADLLDSGAFDAIFDTLDLLVAGQGGQPIRDPVSGERLVDVAMDAIARLLDHPAGGVPDRRGRAQPTLLHLVLEPLRQIDDRMAAATGGQALHTALMYAATDLCIERVVNDNGTPGNPGDDFEELRNPSVGPFLGRLFDLVARNLPADQAARAARIAGLQGDIAAALRGRHFATGFDLARTLRRTGGSRTIRDAVIHLLTPDPIARDDIFGALLKLAATALQTEVDPAPLRDLAAFAADLFDPRAGRVIALVAGIERCLAADKGKTVMTLLRNALNEPPPAAGLAAGSTPAEVLLDVMDEISRAGNPGGTSRAGDRLAELEAFVRDTAAFVRDDRDGLARLFELIRSRPR